MIDPRVEKVRSMTDDLAERIATLGGEPNGTPGSLVDARSWNDYSIGRAEAIEHLGALDLVYTALIKDHREAMRATETADPVTQDMLIEQLRGLELFQWFVRAHLDPAAASSAPSARPPSPVPPDRHPTRPEASPDRAGQQARPRPSGGAAVSGQRSAVSGRCR
ncbi:DNA protection during starvation protein [Streptomyces sp. S4.7]|nr:DNA protection during starvation protein [Streptomyces sp. S4.7]